MPTIATLDVFNMNAVTDKAQSQSTPAKTTTQKKSFQKTALAQMWSDNNKRTALILGGVFAIGGIVATTVALSGDDAPVVIEDSSVSAIHANTTELNEEQRKYLDAEDQAEAARLAQENGSSVVGFNTHGQEVLTAGRTDSQQEAQFNFSERVNTSPQDFEEIKGRDGVIFVREKKTGTIYDPASGAALDPQQQADFLAEGAQVTASYFSVDESKLKNLEQQQSGATNATQVSTAQASSASSASSAYEAPSNTLDGSTVSSAEAGGNQQQARRSGYTGYKLPDKHGGATYNTSYNSGGGSYNSSGSYNNGGYQDPNGGGYYSAGYGDGTNNNQQQPAGFETTNPNNAYAYQLSQLEQERANARVNQVAMATNRAEVAAQRTTLARTNLNNAVGGVRSGAGFTSSGGAGGLGGAGTFGHTRYELTDRSLYGAGGGSGYASASGAGGAGGVGANAGGLKASAGGFATNWVEANQRTAVGTNSVLRPEEDVDVVVTGSGFVSRSNGDYNLSGKFLPKNAIREGTLWRIVTTKAVDTSMGDNTIRGRVVGGPMNGSTVTGVVDSSTIGQNVAVRWTRLIPADQRRASIRISATGLSLDADNFHSTGVATDIKNHYFRNYTGALLESIVEGYGNVYASNNGQTTINRADGTVIVTNDGKVDTNELRASVAAAMSERLKSDIAKIGGKARTYRIEMGTIMDMQFEETVVLE